MFPIFSLRIEKIKPYVDLYYFKNVINCALVSYRFIHSSCAISYIKYRSDSFLYFFRQGASVSSPELDQELRRNGDEMQRGIVELSVLSYFRSNDEFITLSILGLLLCYYLLYKYPPDK